MIPVRMGLPIPIAELASEEPLSVRLEAARRLWDESTQSGRVDATLAYAVRASLAGEHHEADIALKFARDRGKAGRAPEAERIAAFVVLRSGDSARAIGALERARSKAGHDDPFDHVLRAQALLTAGMPAEAAAESERAIALLATDQSALRSYADLVAAKIALAQGNLRGALRALGDARSRSLTGLLSCIADTLGARLALTEKRADVARADLSQAVWRLIRLGIPRELGLAYIAMAQVEAVAERPEASASWLARAQPLLLSAGAPQDQEALRNSFRAFGRRALDRLVDENLATRIETVRTRQARLRDVLFAQREARQADAAPEAEGDRKAIDEALIATREADERLIRALESAIVDRERAGQLVAVTQKMAVLDTLDEVSAAIPRLALELCTGDGGQLVQIEAGDLTTVARHGTSIDKLRANSEREIMDVIEAGRTRLFHDVQPKGSRPARTLGGTEEATGHLVVVSLPLTDANTALVVARVAPGGALSERDVERLRVYGSLAAASLQRARGEKALREAAAQDAATLEAIRDGIVTLREGTVQALNEAAIRLLRVERRSAVGRGLEDLPGLRPLADALAPRRSLDGEIVSLPHGEVLVRSRVYDGGTVATLQELASAQKLAHKLVGSSARFSFEDLVGEDPVFLKCLDDARRAALADVPVLITGESGTGKELLAQSIHNASPRASSPFIGINVAAIPRELLESELFGYERGAFTGARSGGHSGKFELAENGTILLDEIGELSWEMQAKLLRVLQERVVQRLGGNKELPIRARVIATTHRDLEGAVKEGSFRLDLFYRLRVVHLVLPPLRQRKRDVPTLVRNYLKQYCERARRPLISVTSEVMEALIDYDWPGNVRELANTVEGEASLLPLEQNTIDHAPASLQRAAARGREGAVGHAVADLSDRSIPIVPLHEIERQVFTQALLRFEGNIAQAAKALGVARGTFYNKMKAYGIEGE